MAILLYHSFNMNKIFNFPYELFPTYPLTCTLIPSLFSTQECSQLLTPHIRTNFNRAIHNYPTYYRNNDRQVIDDPQLADHIF